MFLAYLLWRIVHSDQGEDIFIVYRSWTKRVALMHTGSKETEFVSFFDPDLQWKSPFLRRIKSALGEQSTWVLLDACQQFGSPMTVANHVLVTSPRRSVYNDFAKGAAKRWMPVWTWDEMLDINAKIYSHITPAQLENIAELSGPIPRLAFPKKFALWWRKELLSEIMGKLPHTVDDLNRLISTVQQCEDKADTSHRILHVTVDDDSYDAKQPWVGYTATRTRFATAAVETMTLDSLLNAQMNTTIRIVNGEEGKESDQCRREVSKVGHTGRYRTAGSSRSSAWMVPNLGRAASSL